MNEIPFDELKFNLLKKTDAERLGEIATEVANRSAAEAIYQNFLKQATDAAEHGIRMMQLPIMKLSAFRKMYEHLMMQGMDMKNASQDDYCDEQYKAQSALIERLKEQKFKVNVKEMSGLILPNENTPKNADLEAIAIVEW